VRAGCQGGAAAVAGAADVLRRRLRVLGGRSLAARRAFSAWRAFQAVMMRWFLQRVAEHDAEPEPSG
jgi:hypothetical protein